jgi:hypothetical protein
MKLEKTMKQFKQAIVEKFASVLYRLIILVIVFITSIILAVYGNDKLLVGIAAGQSAILVSLIWPAQKELIRLVKMKGFVLCELNERFIDLVDIDKRELTPLQKALLKLSMYEPKLVVSIIKHAATESLIIYDRHLKVVDLKMIMADLINARLDSLNGVNNELT